MHRQHRDWTCFVKRVSSWATSAETECPPSLGTYLWSTEPYSEQVVRRLGVPLSVPTWIHKGRLRWLSFLLPSPLFHWELEFLLFRKIFFLEIVVRVPECDESFSKLKKNVKSSESRSSHAALEIFGLEPGFCRQYVRYCYTVPSWNQLERGSFTEHK